MGVETRVTDSRIARGDLADEIASLRFQSLARRGLIDVYRLVIHPLTLGNGLPLFTDLAAPLRLTLLDASTYEGGSAVHV